MGWDWTDPAVDIEMSQNPKTLQQQQRHVITWSIRFWFSQSDIIRYNKMYGQ